MTPVCKVWLQAMQEVNDKLKGSLFRRVLGTKVVCELQPAGDYYLAEVSPDTLPVYRGLPVNPSGKCVCDAACGVIMTDLSLSLTLLCYSWCKNTCLLCGMRLLCSGLQLCAQTPTLVPIAVVST